MELAHIIVGGIVQGVNFRWFVQREAESLGLVGSVRNLPNGAVEVYAEGEREAIEELMETMKQGNGYSRIDRCQVEWKPAEAKFKGFRIILHGW